MSKIMNLFKSIFTRSNVTKLGRWEHRVTDKTKIVRATLANLDHCGDVICGKPETIKSSVDKIVKE